MDSTHESKRKNQLSATDTGLAELTITAEKIRVLQRFLAYCCRYGKKERRKFLIIVTHGGDYSEQIHLRMEDEGGT